MFTTVTPSTVSIITNPALAESAVYLGVLVLLALLVQKELASASADLRFQTLGRALNIGILPLLIAFGLLVCSRLAEILR